MASLTLKGVPDGLLARLKTDAAANRRSLNGEVLHRLERSLAEETEQRLESIRRDRIFPRLQAIVREERDPDAADWIERVRTLREKIDVDTTVAEIIAARDEGRK